MAIYKVGTITATGSAFNLNLGFIPSYFRLVNETKLAAQGGVAVSEWFQLMNSSNPNGYAMIQTLTAGAPVYSQISSNGFTAYQTPDSSLYPVTNKAISIVTTGVSQAANALVTTAAAHGFSSADIGVTTVAFHGVVGMTQINGLTGVIQSVPSTTTFTVNINTTSFSAFSQSGNPIINVITGSPYSFIQYPNNGYAIATVTAQFTGSPLASYQISNTPLYNQGIIGLTVGSSVCGSASDQLLFQAVLDAPFTS